MDPLEPTFQPPVENKEERTWAMACHLAAFSAWFTGFGMVVGPLVVWLIKKDQFPLVDDQGKEALNFNISLAIYGFVAFLLSFVLIGIPILIALGIFWFVEVIIATIRANNGERFRYPLTIRFLK
jgi:uncharacterized Tic20 family protein